jgi:hypothetical protein
MRVIKGSSAWKPAYTLANAGITKHVDDRDGGDHGDDHKHRIAHGGADARAHVAVEFEIIEQAQKDFIKPAGQFADTHHADVEQAEHFGMAPHGGREFAPGIERLAQVLDHLAERFVDGRILQAVQAAHDGHAGLEQRIELAAEQLHVDLLDLFFGQARPQPLAFYALGFLPRRDFHRRHAGIEQLVGHTVAVRPFQHALQQFAPGITGFVSEERHVSSYSSS